MINEIVEGISDIFLNLMPISLMFTCYGGLLFLVIFVPGSFSYNYLPISYIIAVFILSFIIMEIYSLFSDSWRWKNKYFELAAKKIISFIISFSNLALIAMIIKFIQNRITPEVMNNIVIGSAILIAIIIAFSLLVIINVHIHERLNKK